MIATGRPFDLAYGVRIGIVVDAQCRLRSSLTYERSQSIIFIRLLLAMPEQSLVPSTVIKG
jgi:hypothetical protein